MQCGRARSGFTLAELAAAAAIMAIAAAVALPALAWVAASVRQSALDAGAEAVASAAQRSAAEMYLSGELTALYDSGAFAGEVSGEDGDFFYIIQGQSVGAGYSAADFFPSDALGSETSEGFFVVEYALSDVTGKPSGAVQSVFLLGRNRLDRRLYRRACPQPRGESGGNEGHALRLLDG
ncbi:MAG: prepilin-type N-terminal cleavage/methylation domain-containing protein [Oscillospiraceae bacterium]|nr:prepilin-type N-terminal cleavage/methylation domain-containing protein [Oscillospiraceae bacterium]